MRVDGQPVAENAASGSRFLAQTASSENSFDIKLVSPILSAGAYRVFIERSELIFIQLEGGTKSVLATLAPLLGPVGGWLPLVLWLFTRKQAKKQLQHIGQEAPEELLHESDSNFKLHLAEIRDAAIEPASLLATSGRAGRLLLTVRHGEKFKFEFADAAGMAKAIHLLSPLLNSTLRINVEWNGNERKYEKKKASAGLPVFFWLAVALLASCLAAAHAAPPYAGRLGVEASADAFVDVVRQSYRWEKPDGLGGWSKIDREDVDEHGWPKTDCRWVLDSRPCAEWTGEIDDPEAYRVDRSGTYHGSFVGEARLVHDEGPFSIQHQTYDARSNRTTFELVIPQPAKNHGLIVLEFRETRRSSANPTNGGLTDFRLLRPGYAADTARIFTKEYLACLHSAAFSTIRFMGVLQINGNIEWGKDHTRTQAWSNRKLPDDASAEPIDPLNKKDGWPWEYVVELGNQADMDLWINIPMSADDDYLHKLAALIKSKLKSKRNIYIEHSNEVWNWGFSQYSWNKARAGEEVREGKVQYDFDHVNDHEVWGQRRHAQKVKEAVDIFAGVFGKQDVNRRIRGILAGVTPDPKGFFIGGRVAGMLDYLKAVDGDPKNYIYAISMPAYYGGKGAGGEAGTADYSVDQLIANLQAGIDHTKADRMAMVALAKRFDLPGGFCAYESGPDIGGGSRVNIANRIRAIRDPRQAELYRRNFADGFWDLGGNLAMQFTLSGSYSRYGAWGLTDDVSRSDRNALFPQVRKLIGSGK